MYEALSSGKGAVKVDATSTDGYARLSQSAQAYINSSTSKYNAILPDTNKDINKEIFGLQNPPAAVIIKPTDASTTLANAIAIPKDHKFNLPPHKWSLPIRPSSLGLQEENLTRTVTMESFHGLRRGRIWFFLGEYNLKKTNNGTVQETASLANGGMTSAPGPNDVSQYQRDTANRQGNSISGDRRYGFQFLWNPESISSSVSVNMDVVPNSHDRFRSVSGVFLGNTTVTVNLVLDRTNDFACFKGDPIVMGNLSDKGWFSPSTEYWAKYYKTRYPFEKDDQAISVRVQKLMELGTLYDLEYLFKTLNGSGLNDKENWKNLLGRETADIGYIQPVLVGMQLGPSIENLSYVGWIDAISINHVAFTETMVPIRSTVSITFRAMTGNGLVNG